MKIEERPIENVRPYERNPRKNAGAVEGVAESIRRFGFKQPIVIDRAGVIVAGHTRYQAALRLGLKTVPCVLADELDEAAVRAYRILDNKLAEASYWDFDALRTELAELDFDFDGFGVEFPAFEVFPDAAPEAEADPAAEPRKKERQEVTEDGEEIEKSKTGITDSALPPPFQWVGSKTRQRNNLLDLINGVPRRGYIEVFGGTAAVLLAKAPEPEEVYNDLNSGAVAFFRALRDPAHEAELRRLCDVTPYGRDFYEELRVLAARWIANDSAGFAEQKARANLSSTPDGVAAAFAFFYCQTFAFGGTLLGSFGYCRKRNMAETYRNKVEKLDDYAARFDRVLVENLDWREIVKKYDRPGALFFFDPPYECKSGDVYETGWTSADTAELVDVLIGLKGQAVLSCYDGPLYKRLKNYGFRARHFTAFSTVALENDDPDRVETVYFKFDGEKEELPPPACTSAAETEANASAPRRRKEPKK